MTNTELADRIMAGGWDEHFSCPDGLRINFAVANRLNPQPSRVLDTVEQMLRGGRLSHEALAAAVRDGITLRCESSSRPPFPGRPR